MISQRVAFIHLLLFINYFRNTPLDGYTSSLVKFVLFLQLLQVKYLYSLHATFLTSKKYCLQ